MIIETYTDGGARGNPGPAATGAVLKRDGVIIWEQGAYIGVTTNNQAEYRALIVALEQAKRLGADDVRCYLDSELVVKQMLLIYRVKDAGLAALFTKAWNLKQQFTSISFKHIPRALNKEADRMVNLALDENAQSLYNTSTYSQ